MIVYNYIYFHKTYMLTQTYYAIHTYLTYAISISDIIIFYNLHTACLPSAIPSTRTANGLTGSSLLDHPTARPCLLHWKALKAEKSAGAC